MQIITPEATRRSLKALAAIRGRSLKDEINRALSAHLEDAADVLTGVTGGNELERR
jgi:hypothetical protein